MAVLRLERHGLGAISLLVFAPHHKYNKPPFVVPISGSTQSNGDLLVPFCEAATPSSNAATALCLKNTPILR